jgi:hypothetical protein
VAGVGGVDAERLQDRLERGTRREQLVDKVTADQPAHVGDGVVVEFMIGQHRLDQRR